MALEVRIKKKLAHFTLEVDFVLEQDVLALLGASGCGKSMTLKCIAGIEEPDEGRIVLNGRVLYDSEKKINLSPQKRHVGLLFQDYALFPNMTVKQNILVGLCRSLEIDKKSFLHGLFRKTVNRKAGLEQKLADDYIRRFHLEEMGDLYPSQLSGGQKQRVALARMLAANPEVILLDEPFSALDSHLKWELEQEMTEILGMQNKPTVFVSHNRDEVYRICSKVACIENGMMEQICTVKDFFKNPKTRMAAVLSGCKNISRAEWIDDGQIKAIEWDLTLKVFCADKNDINYVGIRTHYLEPVYELSDIDMESLVLVKDYKVIEEPFEWVLMFRNTERQNNSENDINAANWLQWKCAKTMESKELRIPLGFRINNSKLLYLK